MAFLPWKTLVTVAITKYKCQTLLRVKGLSVGIWRIRSNSTVTDLSIPINSGSSGVLLSVCGKSHPPFEGPTCMWCTNIHLKNEWSSRVTNALLAFHKVQTQRHIKKWWLTSEISYRIIMKMHMHIFWSRWRNCGSLADAANIKSNNFFFFLNQANRPKFKLTQQLSSSISKVLERQVPLLWRHLGTPFGSYLGLTRPDPFKMKREISKTPDQRVILT